MASENVFFEEWQRCLREHYLHVVRTDDQVTEPTLREVLLQTGFTLAEIESFYYIGQWQRDNHTHDEPSEQDLATFTPRMATQALPAPPPPTPMAALEPDDDLDAEDEDDEGYYEEGLVIEPDADPFLPDDLMPTEEDEPPSAPPTQQMSLF